MQLWIDHRKLFSPSPPLLLIQTGGRAGAPVSDDSICEKLKRFDRHDKYERSSLWKVRMMKALFSLSIGVVVLISYLTEALTDRKAYWPSADELKNPHVYPQRSVYGIKAIQADGWKIEDLTGNGVGGVVMNFPW